MNLPISILFSFFTNPLTIPFIFFYSYKLGSILLGLEEQQIAYVMFDEVSIIEWFNVSSNTENCHNTSE